MRKVSVLSQEVTVYTDGGCTGNPGPGGWAAVVLIGGERVLLSGGEPATTNNRMELTAVIEALRFLRDRGLAEGLLSFYTDSQYVKKGLTIWMAGWRRRGWRTSAKKPVKNQSLWKELEALSAPREIRWFWVKGHSGDYYNEMCDRLVEQERAQFLSGKAGAI